MPRISFPLPILLFSLFFLINCTSTAKEPLPGSLRATGTILVKKEKREYILYLPSSYDHTKKTPLLLALHGGGGSASQWENYSGIKKLSEKKGFVLVFPNGLDKGWSDGRNFGNRGKVDDVSFIRELINHLVRKFNIDEKRIYAVGVSNGGMMCQRLACELTDKFAAVASIISSLPEKIAQKAHPSSPISVMLIAGTKDPLVPWEGGEVKIFRQRRGRIISVEDTARFWVNHNGCKSPPQESPVPDRDKEDGSHITKKVWKGGKESTEVVLYTVHEGGHTWPGGPQYLGKWLIGKRNGDMNAFEVAWDFFSRHRRK